VTAAACDAPTAVVEFGVSDTVTEATGTGVTVIDDVPNFPSLVAVMTVDPTATAVTKPVDETLARVRSLDDQVTTRPVRGLPLMSFVVAVSCCVPPTITLAVGGVTTTVATGTRSTVRVAAPVFVSLTAMI
jgi:hypothetical protein